MDRRSGCATATLMAVLCAVTPGVRDASGEVDGQALRSATTPAAAPALVPAIEAFLAERVAADEFSGVVLVSRGSETFVRHVSGLADRSLGVPNRIDTRFNLGSVGKIFTGLAVCLLIQEGKLDVDDPIAKYLPDYPRREVATRVTIDQLLTHTSGLGDFFNHRFETQRERLHTVADYMDLFAKDPPAFEPGERFSYSNAGPVVLGRIIEQVSGSSYFDFVRQRIFEPLGMHSTGFDELDEVGPARATGYTRLRIRYDENGMDGEEIDGPWRSNVLTLPLKGSPAGGSYSTAEDLTRVARALADRRLLDDVHTRMMLEPRIERRPGRAYGYLINVKTVDGHRAVGHNGGAPGVSASLWLYLDLDEIVVVLANQDGAARPVAQFIEQQITTTASET